MRRSGAADCRHLDDLAAGHQRRQILFPGERAFVFERSLQGEGRAHDREHVGGHVALDIDAKARLNAVIECRLERRHSVPHLHFDGRAIDTLPPVSAILFQWVSVSWVQWMYSLSGPISPALPTASKLPVRSPTMWQMIGTPAWRASAQLSTFGAAFSSRVNSWSAEEKYCDFSRSKSFGYWLPGPRPGE